MNRAINPLHTFTICHLSALVILAFSALIARAQNPSGTQISYDGTLGPTRIGLTIVTSGKSISGGHYFYAKYLTDIPLTGSLAAGGLKLQGGEGGLFDLKFVGNGSDGGKPLDFNNSVGLQGTWSKDGKSLPVKLSMGGQSAMTQRWYSDITDESDAGFEAKVQGFYNAVLSGDHDTAAKYVAFPLRVNHNGKSRNIQSAAELSAQWSTIFTPAYLAALKKDLPHDLSIVQGQAMLGDGQAFFSNKGVTAVNIP
jgi:hypothetical protein